jgi:hypothetical protein
MKKNMGMIDRVLRTILAIVVFALYIGGQLTGIAAVILGIFAVIFLVTSFTGVCPVYTWLGITTLKGDKHDEGHHGATPKGAH